jgi:hypothetical protein
MLVQSDVYSFLVGHAKTSGLDVLFYIIFDTVFLVKHVMANCSSM